jgi:hypothetical protein
VKGRVVASGASGANFSAREAEMRGDMESSTLFGGATEEHAALDFKSRFDPQQTADWCELIKDVIAMANSGGGRIVIGANDDGSHSGADVAAFLGLDSADVSNKLHKYTEEHFSDFTISSATLSGQTVAVLDVRAVRFPMVFSSPGQYEFAPGKQKTAFGKGTIYFRHGSKSEPGSSADLRDALDRELGRVKEFWLQGITRVVEAPPGSEIQVVQTAVSLVSPGPDTQNIRLTHTGDGPEFKVVDNDQLYPYRVTELLKRLAEVIGSKVANSFDIQQVRKHHEIDDNPNFSHKGRFTTRQYSETFVEWIASEYNKDNQFFQKTRDACRARNTPSS